mgnify:CR=1 FL=1
MDWVWDFLRAVVEHGQALYDSALASQNHLALLATVLSILGGVYTLYKVMTGWDAIRRRMFTAYLNSEEKRIIESKGALSLRLQRNPGAEDHITSFDVNKHLMQAIRAYDKGSVPKAEAQLKALQSRIEHRQSFSRRQAEVAKTQISAIHLFLGSIEAAKGKHREAIAEFKEAIRLNDEDADAIMYVCEQHLRLALTEPITRKQHLDDAISAASQLSALAAKKQSDEGKLLTASAARLSARAQLGHGATGKAGELADEGLKAADWPDRHHRLVADLHDLQARAALLRGNWHVAATSFGNAIARYEKAGERAKAESSKKLRQRALNKENADSDAIVLELLNG